MGHIVFHLDYKNGKAEVLRLHFVPKFRLILSNFIIQLLYPEAFSLNISKICKNTSIRHTPEREFHEKKIIFEIEHVLEMA